MDTPIVRGGRVGEVGGRGEGACCGVRSHRALQGRLEGSQSAPGIEKKKKRKEKEKEKKKKKEKRKKKKEKEKEKRKKRQKVKDGYFLG